VDELQQTSPRFARLSAERIVTSAGSNRKTIIHPQVGPITLDCDVLTVAGSDLRLLVVYTAEPSSPDAEKLRLVHVVGLQQLGARDRRTPGAVATTSS
jgi:MmyB-like transcription regulator ligand binding domain